MQYGTGMMGGHVTWYHAIWYRQGGGGSHVVVWFRGMGGVVLVMTDELTGRLPREMALSGRI